MAIQSFEFEVDLTGVTSSSTLLGANIVVRGTGTGSYGGGYYISNPNDPDGIINMATLTNGIGTDQITTGLIPGQKYGVRIREWPQANFAGTPGPYSYYTFTVPVVDANLVNAASTITEVYDGEELADTSVELNSEIGLSKSLLQVHTDVTNDKTMTAAVKATGIQVSQSLPASYAFGTTMFFTPTEGSTKQSGGIGVFTNSSAQTGYFILIKTSGTAGLAGDEFSILKISGRVIKKLADSQKITSAGKGIGVYAGSSYKIDVKIKVESKKNTIN